MSAMRIKKPGKAERAVSGFIDERHSRDKPPLLHNKGPLHSDPFVRL